MMARLRPRQLEPSKTGPFKFGFDGEEEEDGWVFVKKQRIIIVLPSLPPPVDLTLDKPALTFQLESELSDSVEDAQESTCDKTVVPEDCTFDKPETSVSQAELRDVIADMHETSPAHTLVPALPLPEQFILQKPEASQSQVELRDCVAEIHKITPLHTVLSSSLPVTERFTLQKPATSQLQVEKRDVNADTQKTTTPLQTVMPSLPLPEQFVLQKPATSQSQVDTHETALVHTILPSLPVPGQCTLQHKPETSKSQAESRTETRRATLVHTVIPSLPVTEPATSQSQAEIREQTRKATFFHTVVPSLPVIEHCTLQKNAASQPQTELRDLVAVTHETTHAHAVESETCPDFTSVDKPEIVIGRNVTTRKASAPRRSLQDCRKNPDRRMEIHRSRAGHKPIRFPRVMCSSVVMDNEKLRVLNLEKKVEKAGGMNQWVGSIGLGREFERMLREQRMNKFQMANLTMEKLKQMGALAVGPRRKLIHAICCVYHPHCLRASFN
ncbi:PREDICTED: uncharacterized protein LOC104775918 [Camelina sativa]|uniref:Uncharacterized protein LOC104775918 n=1 Tax=Camelina sativa TaxID=90675 RepID=A0ABM0YAN9_CAMSA|nr:PREDICTED: uncharacterized protein LOC104775918 [Camelina sativa]XP_010498194.1 PREDICTED: uncharacterized protein LOC104775918 [Camelina sativa]XP_010498203.1 PREDICTED: uncharacterized protein LOC104775918 [Camelina sativa]